MLVGENISLRPLIDSDLDFLESAISKSTKISLPNFLKGSRTEEVNAAFKSASEGSLSGILEFTTEPLVSSDIVGNPHSNIFDSDLTKVDGKLVKVIGWYDNEAGYSMRTADLITRIM